MTIKERKELYNKIIDVLVYKDTTKIGKMKHNALNKNWYIKKNILDIYNLIFKVTDFLDEYDLSFRERIYFIENRMFKNDIPCCEYCNSKIKIFNNCNVSYRNTCSNKMCISKHRSKVGTISKNKDAEKFKEERVCIGCGDSYITSKKSNKKFCTHRCSLYNKNYSHSDETKKKISDTNKKTWNQPEYIKLHYHISRSTAKQRSDVMKHKIKNGEFTPSITNTWTHWTATVTTNENKIKKFRSTWDAGFWLLNSHLEYEKIRIPYQFKNTWHNYIVDFVDLDKKIIYEIKPNSVKDNEKNIEKIKAAKLWCEENFYTFELITDEWFIENVSKIDFVKQPQLLPLKKIGGLYCFTK